MALSLAQVDKLDSRMEDRLYNYDKKLMIFSMLHGSKYNTLYYAFTDLLCGGEVTTSSSHPTPQT